MKVPIEVQLKAAGIPEPVREYQFGKDEKVWVKVKSGKNKGKMVFRARLWRFDYAWPDKMIAMECEGGAYTKGRHVRALGFIEDMAKYNDAAIKGWCVIRVTPDQLEDGTALRWLRKRMER